MNLQITITEQQLNALQSALKITAEDFQAAIADKLDDAIATQNYARRILEARLALGLSNSNSECVI